MDILENSSKQSFEEASEQKGSESMPSDFQDMFSASQYLKNHPVMGEAPDYKIRYLSVLEYFVNRYAAGGLFAEATLCCYKEALLGEELSSYVYACEDIHSQAKWITRTRFKAFRLFSNRFILAMDVIYLCAFRDADQGASVFREIKEIYHSRYHAALENLYDVLYETAPASPKLRAISPQLALWATNRRYLKRPLTTALFVANMSAGKSTLINAIVGKKVNRSLSQACTAKLHYIFSKAFEDGYSYEYDHVLNLNADYNTLMDDDSDNETNEILVGTAFRLLTSTENRFCFLDTPGANFSMDASHGEISREAIKNGRYDTLVYVFSAGTTGIQDEFAYLHYIQEYRRKDCRLIFVLNKLDEYNAAEDSVENSMQQIDADLKKIGFTGYQLYPVSGYAGFLAKSVINGESFAPGTPDFFELMRCKARFRDPAFDFGKYYDVPESIIDLTRTSCAENPEEYDLLLKSGMLGLEYVLTH